MRILSLLSQDRPVLRVGEVCRELEVPKSSVSRLLKTMSDHGLLEREQRGQGYVSGRRSLVLADLYTARHTLLDLIDVTLDNLITEFGFAAYAAVLTGPDIIVLRLKHGRYPLRLVQEVGKRIPAFQTAIGRALLARLSDEEALVLIKEREGSKSKAVAALQELRRIRQSGIATTTSTVIPGISAIGAALHDPARAESLGFSISFPSAASNPDLDDRMMRRTKKEAQSIGIRIGDPFWVRRSIGEGMDQASGPVEASLMPRKLGSAAGV
jgi:DNA-binding IclR family transcriptional regulator